MISSGDHSASLHPTKKLYFLCKDSPALPSIWKISSMKFLLAFASLFLPAVLSAQSSREHVANVDLAIGTAQGTLVGSYYHNWFIGKNKRIFVGVGGRFTGYLGRNQYYVTAPAKLTSNGTGPFVIFKENVTANMDTFLVAKPNVYALNALVNLGYRFSPKLQVGFNIDAVGLSFGGQRRGNYINGQQGQRLNAKVSPFNALLVSDNDFGSLNSELYADYRVRDRWGVRAGFQFLFTEYTTETKVQQFPEPNDRFRRKSLLFMIGTSFKINGTTR